MRLPVEALGLTALFVLAGCTSGEGGKVSAAATVPVADLTGPSADYPMVLGQPFVVDGVTYTPVDRMNVDEVGYAAIGQGAGVTAAHKTLPLPSYADAAGAPW